MMGWSQCSRKLSSSQFILLNIALGIGHFITILSAGAYLPMLPYVAGTIGEGMAYAVWGQSNYFTAMGAAFLIARPIMRKFGPKNSAILAYSLFASASTLVLFSISNYPVFTAARTLQGFAAGLSITPSLFLLLENYKTSKQQVAISLWSLAMFAPFSIGPVLGGFFAYVMGEWRLLFLLSTICAFFVIGVIWALLEDTKDHIEESYSIKSPLCLFALFCGAAIALQEFFDIGLLSDLTSREYTLWWVFVVFLTLTWLFLVRNSSTDNPLMRFSVFKYPNYALGLIILCLAFMGFQSSIVQYLIRLQTIEGFTAWHAGLLFLPLFIFSKPLNLLGQYLIHHGYDPRLLATISFIGFAISFWWMGQYMRPATWENLLWPQFLEGAALGLLFISMNSITLSNVPDSEQLHALDVINTFRNIAAGLAITLSDITWDHYLAHERNYLTSPDVSNSENFIASPPPFTHESAIALKHILHSKIGTQSAQLNLNAMFNTLAMFFLILAIAIWLVKAIHIIHKDKRLELIVESLGEEP